MCGIVGYIGSRQSTDVLLDGLSKLEYRGYDSAGLAVYDQVEGLKVVKAFTHEEQAKDQFRKLNETYRDAAQKANFYSTMIMPVSGNLMNISYALTAAFGGLLSVIQGFDLETGGPAPEPDLPADDHPPLRPGGRRADL